MASESSTAGILLRSVAYGEADLVCTFLTAELGKVTAFARGARRSKRRFRGGIGSFSELHLVLKQAGADRMSTLVESEAERVGSALGADLVKMAAGTYLLELLDHSLVDGQGGEVFGTVIRFIRWLSREERGAAHVEAGLHRLELLLLAEAGVLPDFDSCARSRLPLPDGAPGYWLAGVGVIGRGARHAGEQAVALSPATLRYVRGLVRGRFPAGDAGGEREELRAGLDRIWRDVTGREQRSYPFMDEILATSSSP